MRSIPGRRSSRSSDAAWVAARSRGDCLDGSVFLHAPAVAFQAPGGGENQLIQTGRHLEEQGVRVRPFSPWTDRLEEARLLHLFGMSREGLELARVARSCRVPVVLSPICWFEPGALRALAPTAAGGLFDMAKWSGRRLIPALPSWRKELIDLAAAILPNSEAEARQLIRLFRARSRRIHVVPNGVDTRFRSVRGSERAADYVLYVGRIEPRKNVLGLVRATRTCRLPLVVIGDPVPG